MVSLHLSLGSALHYPIDMVPTDRFTLHDHAKPTPLQLKCAWHIGLKIVGNFRAERGAGLVFARKIN